jgi:hypothetical protein
MPRSEAVAGYIWLRHPVPKRESRRPGGSFVHRICSITRINGATVFSFEYHEPPVLTMLDPSHPIFWVCSCGKSCTVMTGSQEISTCFEGIIQPLAALVMAISNPPLTSLYYVYIYIYPVCWWFPFGLAAVHINFWFREARSSQNGSLDLNVQLKFHRSSYGSAQLFWHVSEYPWHLTNQNNPLS